MATSNTITEAQKMIEENISEATEKFQQKVEATYDIMIDKLKEQKDQLEIDLKHEYRNARRYVRANPEQGITVALLTGFVVGIFLGRSIK